MNYWNSRGEITLSKVQKKQYMRKKIIQLLIQLRQLLKDNFKKYNDKLPYFLTILLALILVVAGINLFIDLTEVLHSEILESYDTRITNYVTSFRRPWLTKAFEFITHVGDFNGYLIMVLLSTGMIYWHFKSWRFSIETGIVLLLASLSNVALKKVINRARPEVDHLVSVSTLSYPSGHAMSAMAFYGFLIYVCYNIKMNKVVKGLFIFFLVFLIFSIGISRIYLGVHYPSDIAGGYIAGFIWVIFSIVLFHVTDLWIKRRRRNRINTEKKQVKRGKK